jgi:hypothetical protein
MHNVLAQNVACSLSESPCEESRTDFRVTELCFIPSSSGQQPISPDRPGLSKQTLAVQQRTSNRLLGFTSLCNRVGPQRCWSPLPLLITGPSHLMVRRVGMLLLRPSYPPLLPLVMKVGHLWDMNYLEGWAPESLSYRLTIWEGNGEWTGNYRW